MAQEPFGWREGSELVNELGDERWLGQRIQTERKLLGWSQARLSSEMAKVGHPLPQTAISKIEPPDESRRGGRPRGDGSKRSVTIGEAIGLSKVFKIPLGELLLPPDAVRDLSAWQGYVHACDLEKELRRLKSERGDLIKKIGLAVALSDALRQRLFEYRSSVARGQESEIRDVPERGGNGKLRPGVLGESEIPPEVTVADDILRDADDPRRRKADLRAIGMRDALVRMRER